MTALKTAKLLHYAVMNSFFAIIGITVCILGLLILLGILFVVWKVRKAVSGFAEQISEMQMPIALPARIHAQRREKLVWDDEGTANELLQPLWKLGFEDAGFFEIAEMPGVKVRGLARPSETLWAVLYEHPQAGVWMDFVTRYADGETTIGSLTTSNAPQGDELEHRPQHDKIYDKSLDTEGLYQRHLAARRTDVQWQPVVPQNFQAEFERAYADEMDWRHARGGVTESEIRAIALKTGQEVTDDSIKLLRQANEAQAASALSDAVREKFLEQTSMPAAEWERLRDRLIIVHDRLSADTVSGEFQAWAFDEETEADDEGEEAIKYPEHLTARQGFEYLNSTLPAPRRFEKIAELNEPVPAEIWRVPDIAFNPYE
jgi:hypothetical protein